MQDELASIFSSRGAIFLQPVEQIMKHLTTVKLLLFDWDGVFTDGRKDSNRNSSFSELDTMGINLLRFCYWLHSGIIPFVAIISGEENQGAMFIAERDHLDAVYFQVKNKTDMADRLKKDFNVKVSESLFLFDDVLDIGLVRQTALNFAIKNDASLLFKEYIKSEKNVAYISANTGATHAIREISELIMGLLGRYKEVIDHRATFSLTYQTYLKERNLVIPKLFY